MSQTIYINLKNWKCTAHRATHAGHDFTVFLGTDAAPAAKDTTGMGCHIGTIPQNPAANFQRQESQGVLVAGPWVGWQYEAE
ncbi:hypothetical protein ABIE37_000153 [Arthrobacter bambusae]|uniref:Uncharacterized protein n=1 Tax=Arthrobacter bambusae TaxID=1338426 RepID=A0ABV2P0X0_9MICC